MCHNAYFVLLKIRQIPATKILCKYVILNKVKNLKDTLQCVQYDMWHFFITALSFYSIQKYIIYNINSIKTIKRIKAVAKNKKCL